MAYLTIPARTDLPRYFFSIDLESVTYLLHFEWNDRANKWFMNICDRDDVQVLSSIALVLGASLIQNYHHMAGVPPGEFVCNDTTGKDVDAGYSDLGERVELLYRESTTPAGE